MAVAVALWSLTVTPGEPSVITPPADIRITNVALGDEVTNEIGRTTVKLTYRAPSAGGDSEDEEQDDEEDNEDDDEKPSGKVTTAVLCSLTFGKIEQTTVNVVLAEDEEYLFEVVGKNAVHLIGNYIDQRPPDQDPYSEDESEDAYDLRDVSSDVEIDPNELNVDVPSDDEGRFEEIAEEVEETPEEKSKKRPRESDAMDTEEQGEKLSKSQKKKQKKLKGADGEAVDAHLPEKSEKQVEKKKDKKDKQGKDKVAETKTLSGGVQIVDHKVGKGPVAKPSDMVSMRYIGKLTNGKIFDQNTKGTPFKFRLGKGEVIKGWDVGIVGMSVGGERLLTIPAPMGYGKKGTSGIPGNSTLTFDVKLLSIN